MGRWAHGHREGRLHARPPDGSVDLRGAALRGLGEHVKIGSNGQTQVKDLADPAAAKKEYDKLVAEKRKKGYVDAGSGGGGSSANEDADAEAGRGGGGADDEDEDSDDEEDERPARKPASKRAPAPASAAKPATAVPAAKAATPRSAPGHRLVLDAGGRQVETTLYLEGNTLRMDSHETYASAEAASKAFERLKKLLTVEGYQVG
ncbi:MAG TPA: WGR domain-containing protein [Kofleriaceae bacterium]|nr:WGR domain-containing protein [Kofleriaceae bacterium]